MYAMKGSIYSTGFSPKIPVKFYGQESIKCIDKVCAYVSTRGPQALSANLDNTITASQRFATPTITSIHFDFRKVKDSLGICWGCEAVVVFQKIQCIVSNAKGLQGHFQESKGPFGDLLGIMVFF